MSTLSEMNCFYHPDRPASETCTECREAICPECEEVVAGKVVCRQCVSAIRERIASEIAEADPAEPETSYGVAAVGIGDPQPAATGVYQAYAPPPAHAQAIGLKHIFGGFALGLLAGIAGLAAWFGVVYFLSWNFALFAIGVGWLIGVGTVKGAGGRGGNVVALMSALLAFFFCGIGVLPSFLEGNLWGVVFGLFCLFFGIQQAYKTPMSVPDHW